MSHSYRAVQWTPFKRRFDGWMLPGIALFMLGFVAGSSLMLPAGESFTPLQVPIRATGNLGFLMLSFALCIGPLARLTPRFKPFLYNRRHLGVATFLVALVHGVLVTVWYHGFGVLNPLVSLLVSNPRHDTLGGVPFEVLGLGALMQLFLLAATSHDFWNSNLGPGLWKAIHLLAYPPMCWWSRMWHSAPCSRKRTRRWRPRWYSTWWWSPACTPRRRCWRPVPCNVHRPGRTGCASAPCTRSH